jgi:hypothetical protein
MKLLLTFDATNDLHQVQAHLDCLLTLVGLRAGSHQVKVESQRKVIFELVKLENYSDSSVESLRRIIEGTTTAQVMNSVKHVIRFFSDSLARIKIDDVEIVFPGKPSAAPESLLPAEFDSFQGFINGFSCKDGTVDIAGYGPVLFSATLFDVLSKTLGQIRVEGRGCHLDRKVKSKPALDHEASLVVVTQLRKAFVAFCEEAERKRKT